MPLPRSLIQPQTVLGGTFETPTGLGQGNLFFPPPQFTGINFGSPRSPHLLRDALTAGSFLPAIGDAAGLAADIDMYRNEPAARTPFNYGLTGLGLLPFFPGATVFHGTSRQFLPEIGAPHGKFDPAKVGTGGTPLLHGFGHYVAENPKVAMQHQVTGDEGALYQIDLPDEHIDKMLDWNAPMGKQPQAVQDLAADLFGGDVEAGGDFYQLLSDMMGSPEAASEALRMLDIPGVKAGEGARNYVVFPGNEDLLTIQKRK